MQEWIGIVTNEIIAIWLALALMATWLTILTAVFVWRMDHDTHNNSLDVYTPIQTEGSK